MQKIKVVKRNERARYKVGIKDKKNRIIIISWVKCDGLVYINEKYKHFPKL